MANANRKIQLEKAQAFHYGIGAFKAGVPRDSNPFFIQHQMDAWFAAWDQENALSH